jgi:hypothetical protein
MLKRVRFWPRIETKKSRGFSRFLQVCADQSGYLILKLEIRWPARVLRLNDAKYLVAIGEIVRGAYVRKKYQG